MMWRAKARGFAVGVAVGGAMASLALWHPVGTKFASGQSIAVVAESKRRAEQQPTTVTLAAAKALERFSAVAGMPGVEERAVALAELATQADESGLPDLLAAALTDPLLGNSRIDFSRRLLTRWAAHDPAAALAWVRANGGDSRMALLGSVAGDWAARDPRGAIAAAMQAGGAAEQSEMLRAALAEWGKAAPADANAWLASQPEGTLARDVRLQFWQSVATRDPVAAANFAAQSSGDSLSALPQIVSTWAEREPLQALDWALSLPPGEARGAALKELAGPWAAAEPQAAANYGWSLADPDARRMFLNKVGAALAASAPMTAAAWARSLPPGPEQAEVFSGALARWAERDPVKAASYWAANAVSSPSLAAVSLQPVVFQWAMRDPPAAAKWVAGLAPGAARENAVAAVVGQWVEVAPAQLNAWCQQLPADGVRDEFLSAAAERLNVSAPSQAILWASRIGDAARRSQILKASFPRWSRSDPTAAAAWLATTPLDLTIKQQLQTLQ